MAAAVPCPPPAALEDVKVAAEAAARHSVAAGVPQGRVAEIKEVAEEEVVEMETIGILISTLLLLDNRTPRAVKEKERRNRFLFFL